MNLYRYSATVNGIRRAVTFSADPPNWGHEADEELTMNDADLIVHNERHIYQDFYAAATDADYDAEHIDPRLERLIPSRWEVIE